MNDILFVAPRFIYYNSPLISIEPADRTGFYARKSDFRLSAFEIYGRASISIADEYVNDDNDVQSCGDLMHKIETVRAA